ncbi:MAG: phosphopentomutase [Anaerofustis sp.]
MAKRAIIVVLDSVGIGELPDASNYGDQGSATLQHIYSAMNGFSLPNLEKLGLGNISNAAPIPRKEQPIGAYGKMAEQSPGKDTTTGHWEMSGIILKKAFRTFPQGFGDDIMQKFKEETGYDYLCNRPISGTEVIKLLGEEHMRTKKLIVYTSADSVFQIAAHEKIIPLDELYRVCRITRKILDAYHVGRVIARPFIGDSPETFVRTPNRRDFSMEPYEKTILQAIKDAGMDVAGVGKIEDIFAKQGLTKAIHTVSNQDGIDKTLDYMKDVEHGLIFTNLVDYDMLYGHRNNVAGYANALSEFDDRLPEIMNAMRDDDLLFLTADHGCDPTTPSTDHSREYVPLLVFGKKIKPTDLGIRTTFSDLGQTIAEYLGTDALNHGVSFLANIL